MPDYVNTSTLSLLRSQNESTLPAGDWSQLTRAEYDAAAAIPQQYREWSGTAVEEMDAGEKAAVDAAALEAQRDAIAAQFDELEDVFRAFALAVLDEINLHATTATAMLDAADNATSLADYKIRMALIDDVPTRTIAQMKAAVRNKLGA